MDPDGFASARAGRLGEDRMVIPPRVHVTGAVPAAIEAALREHFELVDEAAGADGILALLTTTVDDALPRPGRARLKVVANYGVGVNNIDLAAARARGVVVANTPDVLTPRPPSSRSRSRSRCSAASPRATG